MSECRGELSGEPGERIARELSLALETDRPSVFFRALLGAGLLDVTFPQIFALVGAVQSGEHHPEGDAFEHTMAAVDAVSAMTRRPEVRFATLAHDIGKGLVPPEERPHYYGHERLGLAALSEWSAKMPLPKLWLSCAEFAIREHMRARGLSKPGKIADFLARLRRHPIGEDGMAAVMMADARRAPEILNRAEEFYRAMDEVTGRDIPESLARAERGEWLRRRWAEAVARVM
jgi:tRNA nucleotidyltransferase (CCA-adding enzyme)